MAQFCATSVGDGGGLTPRGVVGRRRQRPEVGFDAYQRPVQVHRRRSCCTERGDRRGEGCIVAPPLHRQRHTVGGRRTDQRAPRTCMPRMACRIFQRGQRQRAVDGGNAV